jgi:hypothetical protein
MNGMMSIAFVDGADCPSERFWQRNPERKDLSRKAKTDSLTCTIAQ